MDRECYTRHDPERMLSRIRRGRVRRVEATPIGGEMPMWLFTVPTDGTYTEICQAFAAFLDEVEEGSTLQLVL